MAFNGKYNIRLVNGAPTADSVGANGPQLELKAFNRDDPAQTWVIEPVTSHVPIAHTIKSVSPPRFTFADGDKAALRDSGYFWFIVAAGDNFRISTPELDQTVRYWLPSDDGRNIIITHNATWLWNITAIPS